MRDDSFTTVDINVYRKFARRSQSKIPCTFAIFSGIERKTKCKEDSFGHPRFSVARHQDKFPLKVREIPFWMQKETFEVVEGPTVLTCNFLFHIFNLP